MIARLGKRGLRMFLGAAAIFVVAAGVAWAAIPGSSGTINGCYEKRTGILRVIDAEAGKSCLSFETPISWNQRGPQGERGLQGERGAQGERGLPGERGADGARGPQGEQGLQGLQGPQGERGAQGEQGLQGTPGPQGERGPQGPTGAAGPPGGLSGTTIVELTFDNVDDKGGYFFLAGGNAICPSGKIVTGGGHILREPQSREGIVVDASFPWGSTAFNGWRVVVQDVGAPKLVRATVFAVCAEVS